VRQLLSLLEQLKKAKSLTDLAGLVGFEPKFVSFLLYKLPPGQKYKSFEIPKKSGGTRLIQAPTPRLKVLQRGLAILLYECVKEIDSTKPTASSISHGFQKGRSILSNAAPHRARRYVLNFDLEGFFSSINFGRVRGFFIKSSAFKLDKNVATVIAQIACHDNALPQGSPCSPIISELIAQRLDMRLVRVAKKYKCTFTRYADDITFSSNQKDFPAAIAYCKEAAQPEWSLGQELIQAVASQDFKLNISKTRMQFRGSRQLVTGLVVNEKVNTRATYRQYARAMCNSLFKTGVYHMPGMPKSEAIPTLHQLEGVLNHIFFVQDTADRRTNVEKAERPTAYRQLYRDLLFFKYFVSPPKPLIVCEGKTDSIYIRAAIQWRKKFHPALATNKDTSVQLNISFFNFSGLVHRVLDLNGGTGGQKNLIEHYATRIARYKFLPLTQPIILLIDNDKGSNGIFSIIQQKFKLNPTISSNANAYFLGQNLYLVKTPEVNGESKIEDLFDTSLLISSIGGKTLNLTNKKSADYEVGKTAFANFVRANASSIDFSNFDPLLDRLVTVLNHFPSAKNAKPAAI
jgi:RNA-directed DNA polymerase